MGDIRTTSGVKPPLSSIERKRNLNKNALVISSIIILIIVLGSVIKVPRYARSTGYVTTREYAEVRANTSGKVKEILVSTGDIVKKGDPLIYLECEQEEALVQEAINNVEKGEAELELKIAEIAEAKRVHANEIKNAEEEKKHLEEKLKLTKQLFEKGLASGRNLSDDQFALNKAISNLENLKARDLSIEDKKLNVLKNEVATRKDALNNAKAKLNEKIIRAPIEGKIVKYTFYVGEIIRTDMVLFEIFDGKANYIKIRIPEKYSTKVKPESKIKAYFGTYKTIIPTKFYGKVEIMRDVIEGSEDTYYRVAYCSFDNKDYDIEPGTSAIVDIRTPNTSLWLLLLQP